MQATIEPTEIADMLKQRDAQIAALTADNERLQTQIHALQKEREECQDIAHEHDILITRCFLLREALKPFAECVVHLHPAHEPEDETLDGIKVREWREAYEVFTATTPASASPAQSPPAPPA